MRLVCSYPSISPNFYSPLCYSPGFRAVWPLQPVWQPGVVTFPPPSLDVPLFLWSVSAGRGALPPRWAGFWDASWPSSGGRLASSPDQTPADSHRPSVLLVLRPSVPVLRSFGLRSFGPGPQVSSAAAPTGNQRRSFVPSVPTGPADWPSRPLRSRRAASRLGVSGRDVGRPHAAFRATHAQVITAGRGGGGSCRWWCCSAVLRRSPVGPSGTAARGCAGEGRLRVPCLRTGRVRYRLAMERTTPVGMGKPIMELCGARPQKSMHSSPQSPMTGAGDQIG